MPQGLIGANYPVQAGTQGGGFIKCCLFNARSLQNKLPELHSLLYHNNYGIICATESWFNSDVTHGLLDPHEKFSIIRGDRRGKIGGGACVFVTTELASVEVATKSVDGEFELCCVDIVNSVNSCRLINVYRAPNHTQVAVNAADTLVAQLQKLIQSTRSHCVIVGDFNCPQIDWINYTARSDNIQDVLLDLVLSNGFEQLVEKPTRGDNILDLVLTNEPTSIAQLNVSCPFSNSDHNQIDFDIFVESNSTPLLPDVKKFDWSKANYPGMTAYLSDIDWIDIQANCETADSFWQAFRCELEKAIDIYVPVCPAKSHDSQSARRRVSYPAGIRRVMARKRCLWRQYRRHPADTAAKDRYYQCEKMCRDKVKKYEIMRENKIIQSRNPGRFYKYINSKLSNKSGVGALKKENGVMATDDTERANLFNEFFASTNTTDNGIMPSMDHQPAATASLDTVDVSYAATLKILQKLKTNSSSGPDGLPPILFKKLAPQLALPLSMLYQTSMAAGELPAEWKTGLVSPIYKSGLACDVNNYRPVSLTCIACKIMERIIVQRMLQYLKSNDIITRQQHGFLSRRSTTSNLLDSLNDWTLAVNNKHSVAVTYVDYSKAFDVVSWRKLRFKLEHYGITGDLLRWISSFLTGRTQRVKVGSAVSDLVQLTSGVVQGSCIGPLLFVLYINDVVQIIGDGCRSKIYADDLKIYTEVTSPRDEDAMQSSLDALTGWSRDWQLKISTNKCAVLNIHRLSAEPPRNYTLAGSTVRNCDSVKDLGVVVDSDLKFSQHISVCVARAHSRACLIHKCFVSKDRNSLMRAYITYVRPLVEYASQVWSPHLQMDINKLEAVQRRFTKRLYGMYDLEYTARLRALNIDSLEKRRLHADLIFAYKILFGLVDINACDFFTLNNNSYRETRALNPYKLCISCCRVDTRKYFFCRRVESAWNSLSGTENDFSTLSCFKRLVQRSDLSQFLNYV